jgi:hypothetical protein
MNAKTIKFLLNFVGYVAVAGFAFWLGQTQRDFSKDSTANIEPEKPNIVGINEASNKADFENKIATLTHDLEKVKQSNRALTMQLASTEAAARSMVVMETENERRCALLSEKLNSGLYEEAYQGIYSTDFAIREKSLKAMAQLGTPEAKATLMQVVMNEQENAGLRRALIRTTDWHDAVEQATSLLSSKDESVKAAVILAAQDSHFNETEQEDFEKELIGVFNDKNGDFIQIAAIDYLANKNPAKISEITVLSKDANVSLKVNQHIDELISNLQAFPGG